MLAVRYDQEMKKTCIFCAIIAGSETAFVVDENEFAVAFLDRDPINPGHTLVIPKVHSDNIFEMTAEISAGVFALVHETALRIQEAFGMDQALNVLMSNGAAADQSVFHSHVHLIPRRVADGFSFAEEPKPAPTDEQLARVQFLLRLGQ